MKKTFLLSALIFLIFAQALNAQSISKFTLLYTNDEHGWFNETEEYSGAAGIYNLWEEKENYPDSGNFIVLSGGDMWTGPAVSTWYKGKPMTKIMKKMGYQAASAGNHEFDNKVKVLKKNTRKQGFPVLAANITEKKTGKIPKFVKPYIIIKTGNIKVGILGLANTETPKTTFPVNVKDYNFLDYKPTIEKWAEKIKSEGADLIIILAHIREDEQDLLAETAQKYDIPLITGGHSHQEVLKKLNGVLLIQSGSKYKNYIAVDFEFNHDTKKTSITDYRMVKNTEKGKNPEIELIGKKWNDKGAKILSQKIGYASAKIDVKSYEMENLICDSWFHTFPDADIVISNGGGIRQSILEGNITLESPIGVLPFNNTIYQLQLTGAQILDCVQNFCIGGFSYITKEMTDGTTLDPNKTYTVLTTDYLYSVETTNFRKYDKNPYPTGVVYRQPLIDYLMFIKTDKNNPLNNYLDKTPRITEEMKNGDFH